MLFRSPFVVPSITTAAPATGFPCASTTVPVRLCVCAAQATYMNYLAVQETVLQQQCDEETAAMQINAELARQCALLCNLLHNEQ